MKEVSAHIHARSKVLYDHAFFTWFNKCGRPIADRFLFSPVMVEFIMGFADMNKWFLSYPSPKTELEAAINEHTVEDRTHSKLFVEDWIKLRLNERLAWSPSDTLWWWFDCSETELIRRLAMETLDLTVTHPDPLVRFPLIQAIEAVGDVFFSNTVNLAKDLEAETGIEYRYYGVYHRIRETGHLHTDEDIFTTSVLSDEQRKQAMYLVDRIFDMFIEEIDRLHHYSLRATEDPNLLVDVLRREMRGRVEARGEPGTQWPASPPVTAAPSGAQARVADVFRQRSERLAQHPFLSWIKEDALAPIQKLQRFVGLWAVDILGYRDLNTYVLTYADGADPERRAINRWAKRLSSHSTLYLQDWLTLGMNQVLAWPAHKVIEFYFLDGYTEVHRCNMAKAKTYAFSYKSPRMRYWLMRSLEASGSALFGALRPAVERIEASGSLKLDYWAERHHLVQPALPPDAEADALEFMKTELTAEEERVAVEMIHCLFDNAEEQFALSLKVAQENVFGVSGETERLASATAASSDTFGGGVVPPRVTGRRSTPEQSPVERSV